MNISKAFLFCLWGHAKSAFKTINALCIYLSNHRTKRLISPLHGSYQWLSLWEESTESPMIPVMGVGDLSGPRIVRPRVGRPRTRNVGHELKRPYRLLIVFGVYMHSLVVILCRKKVNCYGSDKIAFLNKVTFLKKILDYQFFNGKRKTVWDRGPPGVETVAPSFSLGTVVVPRTCPSVGR